jgi:hypothetical protein
MTFKNFVDRSLPVVDAAWLNAVDRKLYDVVSVFDFMTAAQIADVRAGTLLVDVSAAVGAAILHVTTPQITSPSVTVRGLYFPDGKYLVTTNNFLGANLNTATYGGRYDLRFYGAGRNASQIYFKPTVSGAAVYDQTLGSNNMLNGVIFENIGFYFDNSDNGTNAIHFIKSRAELGKASQNFRGSEVKINGVAGSIILDLGSTTNINEDSIFFDNLYVVTMLTLIRVTSNVEAIVHRFSNLQVHDVRGDVFDYTTGGFLFVDSCDAIMEGTTGVDTAVLKLGGGTTSQSYFFSGLRTELRGATTRALLIPAAGASENTIVFDTCGLAANTPSKQAWAKVCAQHHAQISFRDCILPVRNGALGTFQLVDSTGGFDYAAVGAARSFIDFVNCHTLGDRQEDLDGWVDYSALTAPNLNYRTLQVSYRGCGNIPDSVEYGHPYRMGRSFVTHAPPKIIFRGNAFPIGTGSAALVSDDDLNCVIPLNAFLTEIVVMRKAKSGATSYQIEFIDTLERTNPGTGAIFGETAAANNNVAIFERVPILLAFTGTRAQRTIWARMKAGYTLSAAGATGTPEDGGIYAEVL